MFWLKKWTDLVVAPTNVSNSLGEDLGLWLLWRDKVIEPPLSAVLGFARRGRRFTHLGSCFTIVDAHIEVIILLGAGLDAHFCRHSLLFFGVSVEQTIWLKVLASARLDSDASLLVRGRSATRW